MALYKNTVKKYLIQILGLCTKNALTAPTFSLQPQLFAQKGGWGCCGAVVGRLATAQWYQGLQQNFGGQKWQNRPKVFRLRIYKKNRNIDDD